MAKMGGAQQPLLLLFLRSFLWTLIVTSFLFFFWALFARPTNWYGNDTGGHFGKVWDAVDVPLHALENQVKNVDAPVMTGKNMSMVSGPLPVQYNAALHPLKYLLWFHRDKQFCVTLTSDKP